MLERPVLQEPIASDYSRLSAMPLIFDYDSFRGTDSKNAVLHQRDEDISIYSTSSPVVEAYCGADLPRAFSSTCA